MPTWHIKRQRASNVDAKQLLRAHVDHLPPEKQREFIASALQLIAERPGLSKGEKMTSETILSIQHRYYQGKQ